MIDKFMRGWATKCQNNPVLAVVSVPFIAIIAIIFAVILFLRGDERYKEML